MRPLVAEDGERAEQHRLVLNDGSSWPRIDRTAELEWKLRYGEPTKSDILAAASVLAAYRHIAAYELGVEHVVRQVRSLRRAAALEE